MANYPQLDDCSGVWTLKEVNDAVMGGYWREAGSRGVFAGGGDGGSPGVVNVIDYVTIASTGDAADFGDLTAAAEFAGGFASFTRMFALNGNSPYNQIEYVSIMTTGNAADFGDATAGAFFRGGASNAIRGMFSGGDGDPDLNTIDSVSYTHLTLPTSDLV